MNPRIALLIGAALTALAGACAHPQRHDHGAMSADGGHLARMCDALGTIA